MTTNTRYWQISKDISEIDIHELGALLYDAGHGRMGQFEKRLKDILGMVIEEHPEYPSYPSRTPTKEKIASWFANNQITRHVTIEIGQYATDDDIKAIISVQGVKPNSYIPARRVHAAELTEVQCLEVASMPGVERLSIMPTYGLV
jgi:hypothetical protein